MKRILLIIILFIIVSNINPKPSIYKPIPQVFVGTVLLAEVTIIAVKAKVPIILSSFIDDTIYDKQLHVESRTTHFKKKKDGSFKLITSPAGAVGIAQFLPSTWDWLKSKKILPGYFSIEVESHQRAAQRLFMQYLAKRDYGIQYNKVRIALAAYNAGSGRVTKLIKKYGVNWEQYLPKETKNYLKIIMA